MRTPHLLGLLPLLATPLVAASMADTLVREEWEVGRPSLPADWSQLAILSVFRLGNSSMGNSTERRRKSSE